MRGLLITPVWVALVLVGCGAAQFDGAVYQDDEVRFSVGRPGTGWKRAYVDDQNDLAWIHEVQGAVIQVNGSCDPSLDIPLDSLTRHLVIGFTEREIATRETVPLDGREALRTVLSAKLDGVLRDIELLVVKKDGCVYDFSLVTPPGGDGPLVRGAYQQVVQGFRAMEPG